MGGWQVLVVEDDTYSGKVTERLLKTQQMQVDVVPNANEALTRLSEHTYDLAVIDLALPGMDGWSLMKAIHLNTKTADLPCVAVTAFDESHVAGEARKAGFVAYFPKPLLRSFAAEVERILSKQ
jgi:CheY-like chemotaxis protein